MKYIIDSKNRIGVVTEIREGGVFARPGNVPYHIGYPFAGAGNVGNNTILITATWWERQPDGSYLGEWYDEFDNFHPAYDYQPPEDPAPAPNNLTCLRCKHTWLPRVSQPPKFCPKCNSPYWDKPRKEK